MAGGTAVGAAGLFAGAIAGSPAALGAALVVFGVGSSVVTIGGAGALFRAYPPERRGWALGVRQMAVPLGGMLGAVLVPALEAVGGVSTVLLAAATAVLVTGAAFAVVADSLRSGRQPRGFRTILKAPGMQRLLVVAAFYIIVLQAVLVYTVPAARAAGLSALAAGTTFFAIQVAAGVARIVWGRIADGGGGARRARTLSEAGVVAAIGAILFTVALHAGVAGCASRRSDLRVRRPRLERPRLCHRRRARATRACGPVGCGRGDADFRSLGPRDSGTRCARARGGMECVLARHCSSRPGWRRHRRDPRRPLLTPGLHTVCSPSWRESCTPAGR